MNPSDTSEMTEISNPTSGYHATRLEETDVVFCSEWNRQKSKAVTNSMDTTVFKAAQEGNIDALGKHSGQLHKMLTPTKNTVLHVYIACVAGARLTTKRKKLLKSAKVVSEMLNMCHRLLLQANESGDTALHFAARYGLAEIVGVLIQAAKDWHGDLEEGFSSGEVCCQFLIRRTNKEKNTALHEAVRFDHHLKVVEILTREDRKFSYSVNDAGETPLYIAAEKGYSDLVFEILDTCTNPSYQGPDGFTALHPAAANGYTKITERLLEKEMTLAVAVDVRGYTPLHMAAARGHVSIAEQILGRDKSAAYIGDNDKRTPVHYAAKNGHVDVLKQFRSYCPDCFELMDSEGRSALHYGIMEAKYKVEKFVRQDPWLSSVLLNGKDFEGNTPLHLIANSEKYEGFKFIRDDRVDKMAFNKKKMNALDIILKIKTEFQWKANIRIDLTASGARPGRRVHKDGGDKEVNTGGVGESKYKEVKESQLLVSTLIATVTFAAGFTMPGGYQSDKGPDQGFAVLSRNAAFKAFVMTNTLAMTMSSCAVLIRFHISLQRREFTYGTIPYGTATSLTMFALIAMVAAFLTGTYAVLGGQSSGLAIAAALLVGCIFFVALCWLVSTISVIRAICDGVGDFFENLLRGNFEKLIPKRKL